MTDNGLMYINSVSTWDSGGGIELDVIELRDGRVLAISDEVVVLCFTAMEDLETGAAGRPAVFPSDGLASQFRLLQDPGYIYGKNPKTYKIVC